MEDICIVCAEPLEFTAIPSCGHKDVCSKCICRLRFLQKNKKCPMCNVESKNIYVTRFAGAFTPPVATLTSRAEKGEMIFNDVIEGYFDDERHAEEIRDICSIKCPECTRKGTGQQEAFRSIQALKRHLNAAHALFFCDVCLENRQVFIGEQIMYTKEDLDRHMKQGDLTGPLAESGFKGHPRCKFCRVHHYGDNELFVHMNRTHERCFLCLRSRPDEYVYYRNYSELEAHFKTQHYCCDHPACLEKRFVVFASDEELRQHTALEHKEQLSKGQRKANLQIAIDIRYRREHEHDETQTIQRASINPSFADSIAVGGGSGLNQGGAAASQPSGRRRGARGPELPPSSSATQLSSQDAQAVEQAEALDRAAQAAIQQERQVESLQQNYDSLFPSLSSSRSAGDLAAMGPGNTARWKATLGGANASSISRGGAPGAARGINLEEDFPSLPTPAHPAPSRSGPPLPGSLASRMAAAQRIGVLNRGTGGNKGPQREPNFSALDFPQPDWNGAALPGAPSSNQNLPSAAAVLSRGSAALEEVRREPPPRPVITAEDFPSLPLGAAPAPAPLGFKPLKGRSYEEAQQQAWQPSQAKAGKKGKNNSISASSSGGGNSHSKNSGASASSSAPSPAPVAVSEEVRQANRALIQKIRERLSADDFASFKSESALFMEGAISARGYYDRVLALGLVEIVGELAALCPHPDRRTELMAVHEQEGTWMGLREDSAGGSGKGGGAKAGSGKGAKGAGAAPKKKEESAPRQQPVAPAPLVVSPAAPAPAPPTPSSSSSVSSGRGADFPSLSSAPLGGLGKKSGLGSRESSLPKGVVQETWTCQVCTLVNVADSSVCAACEVPRSGAVVEKPAAGGAGGGKGKSKKGTKIILTAGNAALSIGALHQAVGAPTSGNAWGR